MTTTNTEIVNGETVTKIIEILTTDCQGPSQAFGTLCVAILKLYELDNRAVDGPVAIAEILAEISTTLASIEEVHRNVHMSYLR